MARPTDPKAMAEFEPLKTMEDIKNLLIAKKIDFRRETTEIDALKVDPRLVEQIVKLPPAARSSWCRPARSC